MSFFEGLLHANEAVLQVLLFDRVGGRLHLLFLQLGRLFHVVLVETGEIEFDAKDEGLLVPELYLNHFHLLALLDCKLSLLLPQSPLDMNPVLPFLLEVLKSVRAEETTKY